MFTVINKMVTSNRGLPDSSSSNSELSPARNEIIITNTDTDEEENIYDGYEPLPMNDFNELNNSEGEADEFEVPISTPAITTANPGVGPSVMQIEDSTRDVWSGPSPKEVDIEMDSNKVNEVKQAMLNITLPSSSIPDWASSIPEDEWKEQLMNRLQKINK